MSDSPRLTLLASAGGGPRSWTAGPGGELDGLGEAFVRDTPEEDVPCWVRFRVAEGVTVDRALEVCTVVRAAEYKRHGSDNVWLDLGRATFAAYWAPPEEPT